MIVRTPSEFWTSSSQHVVFLEYFSIWIFECRKRKKRVVPLSRCSVCGKLIDAKANVRLEYLVGSSAHGVKVSDVRRICLVGLRLDEMVG